MMMDSMLTKILINELFILMLLKKGIYSLILTVSYSIGMCGMRMTTKDYKETFLVIFSM